MAQEDKSIVSFDFLLEKILDNLPNTGKMTLFTLKELYKISYSAENLLSPCLVA